MSFLVFLFSVVSFRECIIKSWCFFVLQKAFQECNSWMCYVVPMFFGLVQPVASFAGCVAIVWTTLQGLHDDKDPPWWTICLLKEVVGLHYIFIGSMFIYLYIYRENKWPRCKVTLIWILWDQGNHLKQKVEIGSIWSTSSRFVASTCKKSFLAYIMPWTSSHTFSEGVLSRHILGAQIPSQQVFGCLGIHVYIYICIMYVTL